MRTNSIMSDPLPATDVVNVNEPKRTPPTDFERIANSEEYPQFVNYLESRIKHFQQFVPGGTPVADINPDELPYRWGQSTTVIAELEALKSTLEAFKRK